MFVACLITITILGGGLYYVKRRDLDPAMYIFHKGLSNHDRPFLILKTLS
jgi:hypothetical protein